ncbi:MAG TPA: beta-eliminating lyase-related protein [Phycisphaerales bacterium]|nr:beta-eliminating lyase-related protein [Phycisphaerales bacterium]HRQ75605.1 beta-eliminating lyase-related protein [Phycisphaerales bacterium]
MRTFRSDNNAGLCPEAMQAIQDANDHSHVIGYGDDAWTARAVDAFKAVFGEGTGVFFVATGTAANTLAIASLTQPWEQVLCHAHSHYNDDESTAPERLTHCRTVQIHPRDEGSKITPEDLARAASKSRGDVHQAQPGVLTISNTTEFGTVYSPAEVRALCTMAHDAGYRVHMDGARFANAVAALGCHPRELTVDAGLDALSFGGTKNGLAFGEAVLFFPQGDGVVCKRACEVFPFHRKGTGHLLSKHRFVSAPFAATLAGGAWLRHARHANAMAKRLGEGLAAMGLAPRFAVDANAVFVTLPDRVDRALRAAGHGYYGFGEPEWRLSRLMCSFNTDAADVDALLEDARSAR